MSFQTWLSGAEGDDAADRVVGRHADGHAIAGNDFDSEAAHPAAQLRKYLVARIALDPVKPAGMDRDDRPLHINEIVFAQQLILSRNIAISVP
jgi:hypothetical protein